MANTKFTKMTGAGNDFVVLDNRDKSLPEDRSDFVRGVCRRRLGVGADGVLVVEESDIADFRMVYYNADGSEAEMCGNGGRCVSRYAYLKKIAKENMSFETIAGVHHSEVVGENVRLRMIDPFDIDLRFEIRLNGEEMTANFINTGVPHVVLFVDDVDSIDVVSLGSKIRYHTKFRPNGTNANFVQILDRNHIRIRTYERGVEDETLACGTGAVAGAIIGALLHRLEPPVEVLTRGGLLKVYFNMEGEKAEGVFLEGDAKVIFEGELNEEAIRIFTPGG